MSRKGEEKRYASYSARCPFYHYQAPIKIACDGSSIGCKVQLLFMNNEERNGYLRQYCESGYEQCHIYEALERGYYEGEKNGT